jgi:DNA-binding GntR family transcriptional regulator
MAATVFAEPIHTTRAFEAAVQNILDAIERNRLREGDRLPTEDDLAGQGIRVVALNLAPVRDAYQGGAVMDAHTLEIHVRQLEAMRGRDPMELPAVLDEHFRLLEDACASAMERDWSELFGDLSGRALIPLRAGA